MLLNSGEIGATLSAALCGPLACGDGGTEPPPDPPRPTTVTVTPATAELTALGATVQLSAQVLDQYGQVMAGAAVSWSSSAATVAAVDGSGLVTGAGNGAATITATAGSASGTAAVTVAQRTSTVAVAPAADTVVERDTVRFESEARDANGHAVAGAEFTWASGDTSVAVVDASGQPFTWASGDTSVAVVDASGQVTGAGAGEVEVAATSSGVTGRAQLTVVAPAPTAVAVTPDTVALTALGQTVQLAAEVLDQAGRVMEGEPVSWASGDTMVATVDGSGLVGAVANGAATITATAGSASGEAVVTVMQSAGSVVVSPAAATIALGDTVRLAAEVFDENGHLVAGAEFSWASSDVSVATVDASGLVRGAGEGTATITATAGDALGTSEITVENPDRAALVALYEATDGPNWVSNEGWLTDAPLGEWYGVDTNGPGRVIRLDLGGRWDSEAQVYIPHGLTGPIPPELGSLANLTWLGLSRNALSGPIPPELGSLANLTWLNLEFNELTGPIPPELGKLVNLQWLGLGKNNLTGPIPPELGSLAELTGLSLWGNQLSGPIPPELGNLANLTWLNLEFNELTGPIPPELGNLANLTSLSLSGNALSGPIPPELGSLANLTSLSLSRNALSGPIPPSLLRLDELRYFYIGGNALCVPGTSAFDAWLQAIESHDAVGSSFCNAVDVAVLKSLYDATGGPGWTESGGWPGEGFVEDWYGVSVDSLGRVTELDLARNGLEGQLPQHLGSLFQMTVLRIGGNALTGRLPLSLTAAPLREFHYADTELCAPTDVSFQTWLNAIPSQEGTGVECAPLTEREILEILYNGTGGPNWTNNDKWLTDAPLGDWYGVRVDNQGRAIILGLGDNNLTGRIPPELGNLANLRRLNLGGSPLTGPIPPELGNLANLTELHLYATNLTGPIPPELGNLANLRWFSLFNSRVSGPIPPELGNLANLRWFSLFNSRVSGPIPPELGNLSSLTHLYLSHNDLTDAIPPELGNLSALQLLELNNNELTGPVPPAIGGMSSLRWLALAHNPGMQGALPLELTALRQLDWLLAAGTELCVPPDSGFQAWLEGVYKRRIMHCIEGVPPMAYLTQAVQSREFPVPLVAGEKALLRVFPTVRQATTEGIPPVRARFYLGNRETHVVDIPGKPAPIPTEVDESSLLKSANAEIPQQVVQPGLEMVIEVDPNGTLDPSLGVAKRIPETGRLAVDVRTMPLFDLTLIPFIWTDTQDSSIVDLIEAIGADPQNHDMLWQTRTLLPVGDLAVTEHEPVQTSTNNLFMLLFETRAIRVMEGGTGHYMGMMAPPVTYASGIAFSPGRSSFSVPRPDIIAHELGHNLSLPHAPCGGARDPDPGYPYPDGSTGAWGYDFRDGGKLVRPSTSDLMSYCGPPDGISDYNFTNALRFRLSDADNVGQQDHGRKQRSLLLWGRVGSDSVPFLEPAFVVDAPAALPDSAGGYRVTGQTTSDDELFSISFAMPSVADGDGSSAFAFVLPVQSRWSDALATITLSGPGGSFTLDADSDLSVTILRNPRNGQVRGILRDLPDPATAAAFAAGLSLEVLFSRGIPAATAWRR